MLHASHNTPVSMNILILGISGTTGKLVAAEAIKRGHKVVGIARNPEKISIEGAELVKGTPYDSDTVQKAIAGCDAVIGTLSLMSGSQGLFGKLKTPADLLSVSMKNTVKAMELQNKKRIILMTALGVGDSANQLPFVFSLFMKMTNIKYSYIDHDIQEKILESSNLDWTIVRPVGLNDKDENITILHNIAGKGKLTYGISRNAVAHFMLDCLDKGEFIKQKPGISNA